MSYFFYLLFCPTLLTYLHSFPYHVLTFYCPILFHGLSIISLEGIKEEIASKLSFSQMTSLSRKDIGSPLIKKFIDWGVIITECFRYAFVGHLTCNYVSTAFYFTVILHSLFPPFVRDLNGIWQSGIGQGKG